MTFDNLLVERDGSCAVLTLNRPAVLNALDTALLTNLAHAVAALDADPSVRVLVITGAGPKAFAAGADIRELAALSGERARAHAAFGQRVFNAIESLTKPVIAAINGFALGGGCELALSCAVRIAADTARLGQPEIDLGIIPGFGATQRLPRLVGPSRALDLLLTGRVVSGTEALQLGLVDRVVASDDLMASARALAAVLALKAPLAVRAMLQVVRSGGAMSSECGQQLESALFGVLSTTVDAREGMAAFLEKRTPRFHGQ